MLTHSRLKQTNKRLGSAMSATPSPILTSNPQIQILVDKLVLMSECLPQERPKTLNLIKWEKEKYRPSQNQNRIRIENQISLIKVCNQKVRSRIKPIKRALSIDLSSQSSSKTYKQHYEEIKNGQYRKNSFSEPFESQQQEFDNPSISFFTTPAKQPKGGIKFYQNLKKYDRIVQFIHDKQEHHSQKQRCVKSFYSQTLPTSPHSREPLPFKKHASMKQKNKYIDLKDKQSNRKLSSIINKWKPMSKMDRIFANPAKERKQPAKKLAWVEMPFNATQTPSLNMEESLQLPLHEQPATVQTQPFN